ncbi:hypothetical protein B0H19DRAFT_1235487 [Mycena capillaripes]|nr:hypothetical protein B0H19DRAFT_1235487 [Mycena capillaripes]
MALPQELIEAIVDEVEGKKTLHACSLTARVFVAASQRGLFRRMSLCWDSSTRPATICDRAFSFIQNFPHLVRYVRDLTVQIPPLSPDQAALESVLGMLGNVERLAINGSAAHWEHIIPALTSTICTLISLPSLQRLHFFRIWNLPLSVVHHAASSVRILSLKHISPNIQDGPLHIAPDTHLQTLILPWCLTAKTLARFNNFLLAARSLRRLVMYYHDGVYRIPVTSSASHLQQLELECGVFPIPLDLPHLPALRSLVLTFLTSEHANMRWTLPENLSSAIADLPVATPVLETLTLETQLRPRDRPRDRAQFWNDHSTLPVFDSPTYRQQLPHLRKVHCSLAFSDASIACIGGDFEMALEGFVRMIVSRLPAAHADGMLTFGRGVQRGRFSYLDDLP